VSAANHHETAKALGLSVPPPLLARAGDRIKRLVAAVQMWSLTSPSERAEKFR
jgi:hypothetical protein